MKKESLENTSRLQSLEAEVKHLKGLLSKVSVSSNQVESGFVDKIESKIDGLAHSGERYADIVALVLKELGQNVSADRVSVFDYDNDSSGYLAKYQWCNENFQEYHPSDLIISDIENPLLNPTCGNAFATCSLNEDLKNSLASKFETFQVQSLLILPFGNDEIINGLLVLEVCTFSREWFDFEINELASNSRLIESLLDKYWFKRNAQEEVLIRTLIHKATQIVSHSRNSRKCIVQLLELIGQELAIESAYIVEKGNLSNHHELLWLQGEHEEDGCLSGFEIDKLVSGKSIGSGIVLHKKEISGSGVDFVRSESLMVSKLECSNDFVGWLIVEAATDRVRWISKFNGFLKSLANLLSTALGDLHQENELNNRCLYLLEANKGLAVKETFLQEVLKNAPWGIIKLCGSEVKLANEKVASIFELSVEELVGKQLEDLIDKDRASELLLQARKGMGIVQIQTSLQVGLYTKQLLCAAAVDNSMSEDGFMLFISDVTSQVAVETKYSELRIRYEKILESSIDGIFITDLNANVKFVNKSARDILKYDAVEATQLSLKELFIEEADDFITKMKSGLVSDKFYKSRAALKNKDREVLLADIAVSKIYIDNKEHLYFTIHEVGVGDVVEPGIQGTGGDFEQLALVSPDIVLRLDTDRRIWFYNESLINNFPFLAEKEVRGCTLTELGVFNEVVGPTWEAKINDVISTKEKTAMQLGFSDESKELYFDWVISPELDGQGNVLGLFAIGKSLSEQKNVEKQLLEAKVKAEESDKLKSSFLANISHELRTPLNAIVGFSALLRGDNVSDAERDDYVEVIHKNSDSLMSLINNIIDVAKIESGKIAVEKESVEVREVLQSLYDDFTPKIDIEHKGRVKLYLSMPKEERCEILSDSIRFRQIMVNLIGNAVKFTIKGFIEFGYAREDGVIKFYVKDTGIGISEAKQKLIFQPFRKEVETSNQIYGGTGIGLSICEKIVQALGGEIGLKSDKGKGSEFYFTHPVELQKKEEEKRISHKTITITNPVLQKNYYWPNKMMLLVDENSSAHLQMRKFIEKTGITLVSARTAAGASKLLMNRKDIHLVVMDLKFPDSTGYELVKEIKKLNTNIPVIVHSDKAINGNCDDLLGQGFDACIQKPSDKDEVLNVMDRFLVEASQR